MENPALVFLALESSLRKKTENKFNGLLALVREIGSLISKNRRSIPPFTRRHVPGTNQTPERAQVSSLKKRPAINSNPKKQTDLLGNNNHFSDTTTGSIYEVEIFPNQNPESTERGASRCSFNIPTALTATAHSDPPVFTRTSKSEAEESQGNNPEPPIIFRAQLPELVGSGSKNGLRRCLAFFPAIRFEQVCFAAALTAYLLTRIIGLTQWPIYFFTDEAIQTNHAAHLLENGFVSRDGTFLPTYFANGGQYNLSFSVYAQVIPYFLFGKSDFITRLTSVCITLAGAVALALILRNSLRASAWWSGVLLLGITPAWFLHSRTAFEAVEAVSLYAVFLFFYLEYRHRDSRYLLPALISGALCFYAYSPAQLVMVCTGALLFLSDIRYHWTHRGAAILGLGVLILAVLPYVRFQVEHPNETIRHLVILRSYWVQSGSITQKLGMFFLKYLQGFDPAYWFFPNERDIIRHTMKGYGHVLAATLPFALLGLGTCIGNWRRSGFRAVILALLSAPSGAALAEVAITRALFVLVPLTLLTAIGFAKVLSWLSRYAPHRVVKSVLLAVLIAVSGYMLSDSLVQGPLWYSNYSLYGMQYGGRQIAAAVQQYAGAHPDTSIRISSAWANGAHEILQFFLPPDVRYSIDSIDSYLAKILPLSENDLFIMTPDEFARANSSSLFTNLSIERTLAWPNGQPGFYFVRLAYTDSAEEVLEAKRTALAVPVEDVIILNGESIRVLHNRLDMGNIAFGFDSDPNSLLRGLFANPFLIEFYFPTARTFSSIRALVGAAPTRLTVTAYPVGGGDTVILSKEIPRASENHEVFIELPGDIRSGHIRMEFLVLDAGESAHMHIYEIILEGEGWTSKSGGPGS